MTPPNAPAADRFLTLGELLRPLRRRRRTLLLGTGLAAVLGLAASFVVTPAYQSTTTFLAPQPAQGAAALAALSSLGALGGMAAGAGALRNPGDQYVGLMRSATVSDRLIDGFGLMKVYGVSTRARAREELESNVQMTAGRKDGLIAVSVEDSDPRRAADMANRYVAELRRMTATFAVSEAQQRRAFFERQLEDAKTHLTTAQVALEATGVGPGAIKAEPKAAAEGFARLQAELSAAEVRLQVLRATLADGAAEVVQQAAAVNSLRGRLAELQRSETAGGGSSDYIGRYREYKYREALFEMMARQYELARIDEAREGLLVQVVDVATPAERPSRPGRLRYAVVAAVLALIALVLHTLLKAFGPSLRD